MDVVVKAIERFPEKAALYVNAGDICRSMKRYAEAFSYRRKALELDASFLDAAFSMGFCYEELEQYQNAHRVWTELVRELDRNHICLLCLKCGKKHHPVL